MSYNHLPNELIKSIAYSGLPIYYVMARLDRKTHALIRVKRNEYCDLVEMVHNRWDDNIIATYKQSNVKYRGKIPGDYPSSTCPAEEYYWWYMGGKSHRDYDLPASISTVVSYFRNGVRHRDHDLPAIQCICKGILSPMHYYKDGKSVPSMVEAYQLCIISQYMRVLSCPIIMKYMRL